jgi:hypothetical protein
MVMRLSTLQYTIARRPLETDVRGDSACMDEAARYYILFRSTLLARVLRANVQDSGMERL